MRLSSKPSLWAALACLGSLVAPSAPARPPSPPEIVRQFGIVPIEPATPASDFRLSVVQGEVEALSDSRGNWVVLTFFATWCGPCRSEMPSMEELHRQRASEGVVVLGVSIDDRREVVAPFVSGLDLTFPILWDDGGRVAAAYRATSIPLTYLIDPHGRLVGASRGARDWTALTPMIDELVAALPPDPGAAIEYAELEESATIAEVLNPPTAEVALAPGPLSAGRPFELEVALRWAGTFEEYLPQPPQVALPEGVERLGVAAATSTEDGENVVRYRIRLEAEEPGSYALDPVELRYTARASGEEQSTRLVGPTVEVARAGLPALWLPAAGGAVLVALFAGVVLRRRGRPDKDAVSDPLPVLKGELDRARQLRMEGRNADAFVVLAGLDGALGEFERRRSDDRSELRPTDLSERVEAARYGGAAPERAELDRLEREIARRVESLRPDPEAAARREVRLRTDTAQEGA